MKIKVFATLQDTAEAHENVAKAVRLGGGVIYSMTRYPEERITLFTIENIDEEEFADCAEGNVDYKVVTEI